MLRANLIKNPLVPESKVRNVAWWAILIVSACHLLALLWAWIFASQSLAMIGRLEEKKATLVTRGESLQPSQEPRELAGSLIARNTWIHLRKNSPLMILHRISHTKPRDSTITSFDAGQGGGKVEFFSTNIDQINQWVNSAFGGLDGRLSVRDQQDQGVKAIYAWID